MMLRYINITIYFVLMSYIITRSRVGSNCPHNHVNNIGMYALSCSHGNDFDQIHT